MGSNLICRAQSFSHSVICKYKLLAVSSQLFCLYSKDSMSRVIDMRSDTVTTPTYEMREAMRNAVVGDDVYGEDPTVKQLQEKVAAMLGKESSLFFPSGTMANLTGIMAHASQRGDEVILGDRSHISTFEQGGVSQIGGIFARQVLNKDDGTFDLDEVCSKIQFGGYDGHCCHTKVICIENTHNLCGGRVVPLDFIIRLSSIARKSNIKLHVDGARLFNAATALQVPASELVKHCDSVSICLSKGLGAPVGSLLVGKKEFIDKSLRIRKSLGGGMRQIGILAAAGITALDNILPLLQNDHDNAKIFCNRLLEMIDLGIHVDPKQIETNIVIFEVRRSDLSAKRFCDLLEQRISEDVPVIRMSAIGIMGSKVRAVTHHQINRDDIDSAIARIQEVLQQKY